MIIRFHWPDVHTSQWTVFLEKRRRISLTAPFLYWNAFRDFFYVDMVPRRAWYTEWTRDPQAFVRHLCAWFHMLALYVCSSGLWGPLEDIKVLTQPYLCCVVGLFFSWFPNSWNMNCLGLLWLQAQRATQPCRTDIVGSEGPRLCAWAIVCGFGPKFLTELSLMSSHAYAQRELWSLSWFCPAC